MNWELIAASETAVVGGGRRGGLTGGDGSVGGTRSAGGGVGSPGREGKKARG